MPRVLGVVKLNLIFLLVYPLINDILKGRFFRIPGYRVDNKPKGVLHGLHVLFLRSRRNRCSFAKKTILERLMRCFRTEFSMREVEE